MILLPLRYRFGRYQEGFNLAGAGGVQREVFACLDLVGGLGGKTSPLPALLGATRTAASTPPSASVMLKGQSVSVMGMPMLCVSAHSISRKTATAGSGPSRSRSAGVTSKKPCCISSRRPALGQIILPLTNTPILRSDQLPEFRVERSVKIVRPCIASRINAFGKHILVTEPPRSRAAHASPWRRRTGRRTGRWFRPGRLQRRNLAPA